MRTEMEWWAKIRLEVLREESSKREVLRREGMGWDTLKKILRHPEVSPQIMGRQWLGVSVLHQNGNPICNQCIH